MASKKANSKKSSKPALTKKAETEVSKIEKVVKTTVKNVSKNKSFSLEEVSKPSFIAAVVLEFIGTFLLAASVLASQGQPVSVLFTLSTIVLIAGAISGAHVNPLITVGAWATRRISTLKAIFYIVAQILGAMVVFMLMNAFVSNAPEVSQQAALYGQQKAQIFAVSPLPKNKESLILISELIGSFIFAFSVASITSDKKKSSAAKAIGVGSALFAALLIAGTLANFVSGSVIINPAIAFSLQAFTITGQNVPFAIAIYIGAALLGGILGFILQALIEKGIQKEEK